MAFELSTYLKRIGNPQTAVSIDGLANLQIAHMRHIPFENIDVLLDQIPGLDDESIWQKLVVDQRGGYCFEQNALFSRALAALGFEARAILGRVRLGAAQGGARTHRAAIVTLNGTKYLSDVGFGGPGPRGPVRLDQQDPQHIDGETFRVRQDETTGETVLERLNDADWFALYGFDQTLTTPEDFVAANFFCAKWPESPFTKYLMMTISHADTRVTLFNRLAKYTRDGAVKEVEITSQSQLQNILTKDFRITINDTQAQTLWAHIKDAPNHRPG